MKNLIYIAAVCLFFLSSCKKDLDQHPLSSATTETFFESQSDFLFAVDGAYAAALRGNTLGNSYGYPDRLMNLSETRSDNLYAITDGARLWEGINGFQSSIANNSYVAEAWVNNYDAIAKANLILEQVIAKPDVFYDDSTKNSIIAQTKFIRAFCYFDLIRWFGKVPLVDHTITVADAQKITRSPVTDVYALAMSDMQFAIDHLNAAQLSTNVGRVTKWAAEGMMAEMYMARSGPTYGIEGPGLGLNEWDKAYALLNDIATNGKSTKGDAVGYDPTYSDIFKTETNKEIIFDVQYITGTDAVGASFVWICTADEYFQSIGLSAQGANYRRPVANSFRSEFAAKDARLKFSIIDSFTYNNITYVYPMYIKWVDKSRYGSGRTNWGVNFPIIRYTDVMMLRSECTLHGGGGSQADVDGVMQAVRSRAGDSTVVSGTTLEDLFKERRKEFCEEGTRWFDLQRSGHLVDYMNAFRAADDALNNRISPVTNNSVIYPVPQAQMNIAPGLYTQNPGYD